jgi:hypothetical protein
MKRKVDEVFSKHIRYKAANANGYAHCFTCGQSLHVSKLHCGHFASRKHMAVRWEPDNVAPQCYACNFHGHGEQWLFGRNIDLQKPGRAAEIMQRAKQGRSYKVGELRDLFEHHEQAANEQAQGKKVATEPRAA